MDDYRVWKSQRVMKKAFARNLEEIQRDFTRQTDKVVDSLIKIYLLPESHNGSLARPGKIGPEMEHLMEDVHIGLNATYWNMMTNKLPTFDELYDEFFCSEMDRIAISEDQAREALADTSCGDEGFEKQYELFKRGLLGFVNAYFVKLCERLAKEGRLECHCCSTRYWIPCLLQRDAEGLWAELQEAPHTLLRNTELRSEGYVETESFEEREKRLAYEAQRTARGYERTFRLLAAYDSGDFEAPEFQTKERTALDIEGAQVLVDVMKKHLAKIDKEDNSESAPSEFFGQDADGRLESAIAAISQTFDGVDLYGSAQERAANLLYLVVKNHPFADGNKRLAAGLFVYYLRLNELVDTYSSWGITDEALVALVLFIAMSDPVDKDRVITLTVNLMDALF